MSTVRLPERGRLAATGPVDAITRYHDPVIGPILRRRLVWAALALPDRPIDRALEIGYGSGVFQYTLAARARLAVGIDIHAESASTKALLRKDGVSSELLQGDGAALPFADGRFDVVVILSALEFIPDPQRCLDEALRVLAPGGRVICVSPRILRWADEVYRRLVGFDPEEEFKGGRQRVQAALASIRRPVRRLARPAWVPPALAPYEVIILEERRQVARTRGERVA